MKTIATCFLGLMLISSIALADVYVNGYYKSNGTYVEPYYRSNPDGNQYNNWSTKGNVNPYTGQPGYKVPNTNLNSPGVIQPYYQNNNSGYGH